MLLSLIHIYLDVVLGLENRIVYNLVDVVEGNCRLKQAMITDKRCPYLYLLPTAQTRDKSAISPEQMIKLVDEIKADPENFDYILLDCPAGIEQGFQNAIVAADRALVVTTPEVSAIRDADRIVGLLDANGLKDREDLIVNRIRMDMVNRGEMMSIADVNDILQLNVIGAVPDDENIVVATNKGQPLVGDSSMAGQAYMNICHRILGEDVPFLDLNGKGGFFKKLSSLFKGCLLYTSHFTQLWMQSKLYLRELHQNLQLILLRMVYMYQVVHHRLTILNSL